MIELKSGARFNVQVKPNSPRNKFLGEIDGFYTFRIKAIPDKGKANAELLRFISKEFRIKARIIAGAASRKKILEVL